MAVIPKPAIDEDTFWDIFAAHCFGTRKSCANWMSSYLRNKFSRGGKFSLVLSSCWKNISSGSLQSEVSLLSELEELDDELEQIDDELEFISTANSIFCLE